MPIDPEIIARAMTIKHPKLSSKKWEGNMAGGSTTRTASTVVPGPQLKVVSRPGETGEAALAKFVTRPTVQAAITANALLAPHFKEQDLNELILALSQQVSTAHDGDLARAEAMLVSQAQTLDLLFNKLTRHAVQNIGHYPDSVALYMKLALRAQSQCRAAAETLHEMKHPRAVTFFQQAPLVPKDVAI